MGRGDVSRHALEYTRAHRFFQVYARLTCRRQTLAIRGIWRCAALRCSAMLGVFMENGRLWEMEEGGGETTGCYLRCQVSF